jgi:hypothetical protein
MPTVRGPKRKKQPEPGDGGSATGLIIAIATLVTAVTGLLAVILK